MRSCGFGHNFAFELLGPEMYAHYDDLSTSCVAQFYAPRATEVKLKMYERYV